MHTWLPDAHSEAPTPVSALLSGSLLAVSFYAILRFYQFTAAALGRGFPRDALLAFGVASLLLAALYVFGQRDVKRLLAYSSVEHMGILAIGVSFGAPVALAGVMLHVLAHAAAKGNAFMGAGVLVPSSAASGSPRSAAASTCCRGAGRCSCSRCSRCRRCRRRASSAASSRSSTAAWVGQLRRRGGPGRAGHGGLLRADRVGHAGCCSRRLRCEPARPVQATRRGEPSAWMVVPVMAGVAVLFILGLHPPGELTGLIAAPCPSWERRDDR